MKFLSSLSAKITLGIVLISATILIFISIFAVSRAQEEFGFATIQFGKDVVLVQTLPDRVIQLVDNEKADFTRKLMLTVFVASLLSIILAVCAGIIFSIYITKPLAHLRQGIINLKKSKYKSKLELTGEKDFDEVIEEFNSLSEELEYQETLRRDLISDVSHELKTPLTSLIGQIDGVKDKVLELNDQRIALIKHDIERLTNLVNMLQDYTSLRASTLNMNKEKINLYDFFENIKNLYSIKLKENNINLNFEVDKALSIEADRALLERIAENIIDNAIKYSKASEIKISADKKQIIISDNGIGIPEEHLKKIFERFYRVEKSRNRKTGGLGLGLALVKEMVEAHGWEIEALSNSDGKGVSFVISL